MLVTLLTNGSMLNNEKLMNTILRVPLKDIRVSVYGMEDIHDGFVGVKGSFLNTVLALEKIRSKKGIGTGVYIATKHNYKDIVRVEKLLNSRNIPMIISAIIMPTSDGNLKPTLLRLEKKNYNTCIQTKNFH